MPKPLYLCGTCNLGLEFEKYQRSECVSAPTEIKSTPVQQSLALFASSRAGCFHFNVVISRCCFAHCIKRKLSSMFYQLRHGGASLLFKKLFQLQSSRQYYFRKMRFAFLIAFEIPAAAMWLSFIKIIWWTEAMIHHAIQHCLFINMRSQGTVLRVSVIFAFMRQLRV